jgi:hypothetical protein
VEVDGLGSVTPAYEYRDHVDQRPTAQDCHRQSSADRRSEHQSLHVLYLLDCLANAVLTELIAATRSRVRDVLTVTNISGLLIRGFGDTRPLRTPLGVNLRPHPLRRVRRKEPDMVGW